MILISAATILAQNVYRPLTTGATDRQVSLLARALVPVIALVAVVLTLRGGSAIVNLLLMGYNLVTQLFPAVVLSLGRRRVATAASVFAGIVAGEATVAYISLTGTSVAALLPWAPDAVKDLNVGIVALIVNVVVFAIATLATSGRRVSQPAGDAVPVPVTGVER
jgi:SSS family solute:Na+ symporter